MATTFSIQTEADFRAEAARHGWRVVDHRNYNLANFDGLLAATPSGFVVGEFNREFQYVMDAEDAERAEAASEGMDP